MPAQTNWGYNLFLGDSTSDASAKSNTNYNYTAPYWSAWLNSDCSSSRVAVCEVAATAAFASCSQAPPAAPPPAAQPSTGLCKCPVQTACCKH